MYVSRYYMQNTKTAKTIKRIELFTDFLFYVCFKKVKPGSCAAFVINLKKEALNRSLEQ